MPSHWVAHDLQPHCVHFSTSGIPEYVLYMSGTNTAKQTLHVFTVASFLPFFTGILFTSVSKGSGCLVCMWI